MQSVLATHNGFCQSLPPRGRGTAIAVEGAFVYKEIRLSHQNRASFVSRAPSVTLRVPAPSRREPSLQNALLCFFISIFFIGRAPFVSHDIGWIFIPVFSRKSPKKLTNSFPRAKIEVERRGDRNEFIRASFTHVGMRQSRTIERKRIRSHVRRGRLCGTCGNRPLFFHF